MDDESDKKLDEKKELRKHRMQDCSSCAGLFILIRWDNTQEPQRNQFLQSHDKSFLAVKAEEDNTLFKGEELKWFLKWREFRWRYKRL